MYMKYVHVLPVRLCSLAMSGGDGEMMMAVEAGEPCEMDQTEDGDDEDEDGEDMEVLKPKCR